MLQGLNWIPEEKAIYIKFRYFQKATKFWPIFHTANMCSEITVEVHLKNCNFEKLQFFTVDLCSLYFLQVKNCKFNTIFM